MKNARWDEYVNNNIVMNLSSPFLSLVLKSSHRKYREKKNRKRISLQNRKKGTDQ